MAPPSVTAPTSLDSEPGSWVVRADDLGELLFHCLCFTQGKPRLRVTLQVSLAAEVKLISNP